MPRPPKVEIPSAGQTTATALAVWHEVNEITDCEAQRAAYALQTVVSARKQLEHAKQELLEPLNEHRKRLAAQVDPQLEKLEALETKLRGLVSAYVTEQRKDAIEAAQQLAATESNPQRAEALVRTALATVPVELDGVGFMTQYAVVVEDDTIIPSQYVKRSPRTAEIIAAFKRGETIPGVRVTTTIGVRVDPSTHK